MRVGRWWENGLSNWYLATLKNVKREIQVWTQPKLRPHILHRNRWSIPALRVRPPWPTGSHAQNTFTSQEIWCQSSRGRWTTGSGSPLPSTGSFTSHSHGSIAEVDHGSFARASACTTEVIVHEMLGCVAKAHDVFFLRVYTAMSLAARIYCRVADDAVHLHSPRQVSVVALLAPSLLHLLRVRADLQALATAVCVYRSDRLARWSTRDFCRPRHAAVEYPSVNHTHGLRDSHAVQPICVRHFSVVEPWAVASLPLVATHHAELCRATALHVIAAFAELDHSIALIAALPAFLFGLLNKTGNLWVLGTVG